MKQFERDDLDAGLIALKSKRMNNISTIIKDIIYKNLREENEKDRLAHKKSGKLSAGQLGNPTQWQILSALKVKSKNFDDYTLGKFKRGNEVEDFIVDILKDEIYNTQVECSYKDCVGLLDIELFGNKWGTSYLPVEVKSVTNMAFKWLLKDAQAKQGHKLQAGIYALSLNLPKYSVLYVASDDYRPLHLIYDTADIKDEIDLIIASFNAIWKNKEIPVFESIEKWQEKEMYNSYPEWSKLTEYQLKIQAKDLFKGIE